MVSQLRMYRAKEGELDVFIEEWRAKILPLRRRFGFKVEGVWTIRDTGDFFWILTYDGPEGLRPATPPTTLPRIGRPSRRIPRGTLRTRTHGS